MESAHLEKHECTHIVEKKKKIFGVHKQRPRDSRAFREPMRWTGAEEQKPKTKRAASSSLTSPGDV